MFQHAWKIFKYETYNLLRSKWVIGFGLFFMIVSEVLFRFDNHPDKALISLMNVVLLLV